MEELAGLFIVIGFSAVFLLLGWCVGSVRERAHLRSLKVRFKAVEGIQVLNTKVPPVAPAGAPPPRLLTGEAVIASDYFKTWISSLTKLFGGEMRQYTRLYQRARDESLLRVLEAAHAQGYNTVCNVRYDASEIGGATTAPVKGQAPMAVCAASATACCAAR